MPRASLTHWRKLDRLPPVLCFLLARYPHKGPIPLSELQTRSGLSAAWVSTLCDSTSWNEVPIGVCRKFMDGCGIDLDNHQCMDRVWAYLRGHGKMPTFSYLRRSREWKTLYKPSLAVWLASLESHPERDSFWTPILERWKRKNA